MIGEILFLWLILLPSRWIAAQCEVYVFIVEFLQFSLIVIVFFLLILVHSFGF